MIKNAHDQKMAKAIENYELSNQLAQGILICNIFRTFSLCFVFGPEVCPLYYFLHGTNLTEIDIAYSLLQLFFLLMCHYLFV